MLQKKWQHCLVWASAHAQLSYSATVDVAAFLLSFASRSRSGFLFTLLLLLTVIVYFSYSYVIFISVVVVAVVVPISCAWLAYVDVAAAASTSRCHPRCYVIFICCPLEKEERQGGVGGAMGSPSAHSDPWIRFSHQLGNEEAFRYPANRPSTYSKLIDTLLTAGQLGKPAGSRGDSIRCSFYASINQLNRFNSVELDEAEEVAFQLNLFIHQISDSKNWFYCCPSNTIIMLWTQWNCEIGP